MYLTPNFQKLTIPCYIAPQSTSGVINYFSARDLQAAAQSELLKHTPKIDERAIFAEAEDALKALDTFLRQAKEKDPERTPTTLLDAAVFSYTFLLLGLDESGWADGRLAELVGNCDGLKTHKEEIRKGYFRARVPGIWKRIGLE
jgi:metaxin